MEGIRLTPLIRHTRVYQEIREEEAADVIGRQLKKRFGQDLSEETRALSREFTLNCSSQVE